MKKLSVGVLMLGFILPVGIAGAADIKVLSTGNMQTVLAEITPDFERTTGHKLVIEYGSTPRIKARAATDSRED